MAYKQSPGRMNMPKTGKGIPSALTMPDPSPKEPKKKYGKVTVKKEKKDGMTTVTATRPFSTETSKGKDLGPDFKPTKAQTERANKRVNKRRKGKETKTFTYVDISKSKGIQATPSTPKPKIDLSKKPSVDKDYGSFTFGSNAHNMNFGGHSTYGKTAAGETPKFSQSYTESPKNPMSGKANIAKSRKITSREDQLMKSNFYNPSYHPMKDKKKFDTHLTNIETFEKRKNDKKFARQELIKSRKKARK